MRPFRAIWRVASWSVAACRIPSPKSTLRSHSQQRGTRHAIAVASSGAEWSDMTRSARTASRWLLCIVGALEVAADGSGSAWLQQEGCGVGQQPGVWPRSSLKAVAAKWTRLKRLLGGSLRSSSSSSTTTKVCHAYVHANSLNVSFCHHIDLTALCRAASDDTPMPLCLMRVCWQVSHTVASCLNIGLALISGDAEGVRAR